MDTFSYGTIFVPKDNKNMTTLSYANGPGGLKPGESRSDPTNDVTGESSSPTPVWLILKGESRWPWTMLTLFWTSNDIYTSVPKAQPPSTETHLLLRVDSLPGPDKDPPLSRGIVFQSQCWLNNSVVMLNTLVKVDLHSTTYIYIIFWIECSQCCA